MADERGYRNDESIDSSVARPAVACAFAGDIAEAEVGEDAGMGGSAGTGMAGRWVWEGGTTVNAAFAPAASLGWTCWWWMYAVACWYVV